MADRETALTIVILLVVGLLVVPVLVMGLFMATGPGHVVESTPMAIWIVSLLVATVLIVGVGLTAYRVVGPEGDEDPAVEELRVAYARGDIDDEEFEKRYERLREE